jgi:transcriptional regulator with XRE-family HTH domain
MKKKKEPTRGKTKAQKRVRTKEAVDTGNWVAGVRKKEGLTQQELADRLKVDRSTLASWETGDYRPSAESLIRIGNEFSYAEALVAWEKAGINTQKLEVFKRPMPGNMERLTGSLFPFEAGDVIGIDNSPVSDIWALLGEVVVVSFDRYPAEWPAELSQRDRQRMMAAKVDFPKPTKAEIEDLGKTELAKRWTPDEHGEIEIKAVLAGWLRLQIYDDPDFVMFDFDQAAWPKAEGRWRLVLQGANVKGIGIRAASLSVPLTSWETRPKGRMVQLRGKQVLGCVTLWIRARELSAASPDFKGTRGKSRKEPE